MHSLAIFRRTAATGLVLAAAATAALAQTTNTDDFIATPGAGMWSASEMIGLTVHDGEGASLGPVVDVLTGPAGGDDYIVFETGGFLGSGEKQIAAPLRSFHITAAPGREERSATSTVLGTELPPENAQDTPSLTGGAAAVGLKPLFLELRVTAEDLATAPPFSVNPQRIPAIAP